MKGIDRMRTHKQMHPFMEKREQANTKYARHTFSFVRLVYLLCGAPNL